ncbi:MAG: 5-(carboxyamino)imidazole ribonucleotide mutase [Candidatus Omnitrophica bacterium]|nr:5-(carboxyamino)imidazole ribonucleotide mutase [Candidatus Omnitrophota bacterium]MCM8808663.1 5-(carboxyamino)imidazole ribonucleotide mutase [Candidatus Omnitrophota bacterium]MCM8833415.1 5-(carboxyamino)imidazole ribonucleotide mutase [Candidatus Omnitrophota bacterium]
MKIVIIMGSKVDIDWAKKIESKIKEFGVDVDLRISSAHKTPIKVLEIIKEYEKKDVVFITVAGRSNALGGFVDANTTKPVITCPPYSDKFSGFDIFSSLRMPSGVAPLVILEPEQAAIAAIKILSIKYTELSLKIKEFQEKMRQEIEKQDKDLKNGKC